MDRAASENGWKELNLKTYFVFIHKSFVNLTAKDSCLYLDAYNFSSKTFFSAGKEGLHSFLGRLKPFKWCFSQILQCKDRICC